MRNKILLVILGITMFFSMNLSVNAEDSCVLTLKSSSQYTLGLKVKIVQKGKKLTYYYSSTLGNDSDKWEKCTKDKDNAKKATCGKKYTIKLAPAVKTNFDTCPEYASETSNNKYTISNKSMSKGEGVVAGNKDASKVDTAGSGKFGNSSSSGNTSGTKYEILGATQENLSCQDMLGDKLTKRIQEIINIIKIAIPILLIVFGMIDFGKGIFSMDENEMKKSQSKFMKRVIVAVAFFMIPTFIGVILNIASKIWDIDPSLCGIKF